MLERPIQLPNSNFQSPILVPIPSSPCVFCMTTASNLKDEEETPRNLRSPLVGDFFCTRIA